MAKEERKKWPQYCPECSGEHGNQRFIRESVHGGGEVSGRTCTNEFHAPRKKRNSNEKG